MRHVIARRLCPPTWRGLALRQVYALFQLKCCVSGIHVRGGPRVDWLSIGRLAVLDHFDPHRVPLLNRRARSRVLSHDVEETRPGEGAYQRAVWVRVQRSKQSERAGTVEQ